MMGKFLSILLLLFSVGLTQDQEGGPKDSLIGKWFNENKDNPGLTRCTITYEEGMYVVELWGKCHPKDCYWGKSHTSKIEKDTPTIELVWDQGFVKRDQTIEVKDGILSIETASRYNDGRESRLHHETFVRNGKQ